MIIKRVPDKNEKCKTTQTSPIDLVPISTEIQELDKIDKFIKVDRVLNLKSNNAIANSVVTQNILDLRDRIPTNPESIDAVPKTRKINGKALDQDITLTTEDIQALPKDTKIPIRISDLQNDSNFVTADVLSGFCTKKEVEQLVGTQGQGTVKSVKVNNTNIEPDSKGVVDIGNVIRQHQDISHKQDKLKDGVNIKTINGKSLLGSGDVEISKGEDGITPHINSANNHWMIGTRDTGVSATGPQGPAGSQGAPGTNGTNGKDGKDGEDGKSAYEIYCQYTEHPLTEEQWVQLQGGDIYISSNVKYLEDQPKFKRKFCYSDDPDFKQDFILPNKPQSMAAVGTYFDTFKANNKKALQNAKETRQFLQGVIDNAQPDEIIIFPKGKTFIVDLNELGLPYDYRDSNGNDGIKPLNYWNIHNENKDTVRSTKFCSLYVKNKVRINLNGSTIKLFPNIAPNYNVFNITTGLLYYESHKYDTYFNTTPDGTIIENGTIDGGRTSKTDTDVFGVREHGNIIHSTCNVTLDNLTLCNTYGDGVTSSSLYVWGRSMNTFSKSIDANSPFLPYTESDILKGYIDTDGKIKQEEKYSGQVYTPVYELRSILGNFSRDNIAIRPYYLNDKIAAMVDSTLYYVNEYFTVAYYSTFTNENNFNVIDVETIQFGDTLHIPEGTAYVRFSAQRDPSYDSEITKMLNYYKSGSELKDFIDNYPSSHGQAFEYTKLMCLCVEQIRWAYGVKISNCTMYNCGRDGITLASLPQGEIVNCHIYNCEQDAIDVESTAYLDSKFTIKGLRAEGQPIACTTGHSIKFDDCRIGHLLAEVPDIIIDRCDINKLVLPASKGWEYNNLSKPKNRVSNSIIRDELVTSNSIFDNCVIGGNKISSYVEVTDHVTTLYEKDGNGYKYSVYAVNNKSHSNNANNKLSAKNDRITSHTGDFKNIFNSCIIKATIISPDVYRDCTFQSIADVLLESYAAGATYEQNTFTFDTCKFDVASIAGVNNGVDQANTEYGVVVDINNCDFNLKDFTCGQMFPLYGTSTDRYKHFTGCYIKNFTNSVVKYDPTAANTFYNGSVIQLQPFRNAAIRNNRFIATKDINSDLTLIRILLNNLTTAEAYRLNIEDNTVKCNFSSGSKQLTFVRIVPIYNSDSIDVNISNTVFNKDGGYNYTARVVYLKNPTNYGNINITLENNKNMGGSISQSYQ